MKLLLTSGGLRNESLNEAFLELVGLPASDITVAFIPTAQSANRNSNQWQDDHTERLQKLGVKEINIVDIATLSKEVWLPCLERSNVIYVRGGNTNRLMTWIAKSGLQKELPALLKDRVYVGTSAGSYVMSPDIRLNSDGVREVLPGLNYVGFWIQAHYKNPDFPLAQTHEMVLERIKSKGLPSPTYVLDDESAIQVVDRKIDIISEGEYFVLNN